MIWEVDENLDGCVDWEEFKLMFQRNLNDATGLEPFQLFNVVQVLLTELVTFDFFVCGVVSLNHAYILKPVPTFPRNNLVYDVRQGQQWCRIGG
jgi:hypothetical protein